MSVISSSLINLEEIRNKLEGATGPISFEDYYFDSAKGYTSSIKDIPSTGSSLSFEDFANKSKYVNPAALSAFQSYTNAASTLPNFTNNTIDFPDGNSKYLDFASQTFNVGTKGFTLVCKINLRSNAGASDSRKIWMTSNGAISVSVKSGNLLEFSIKKSNNATVTLTSTTSIEIGFAYVLILRVANNVMSMWINGVKHKEQVLDMSAMDVTSTSRIGADTSLTSTTLLKGTIEHFSIHNKGLQDTAIYSFTGITQGNFETFNNDGAAISSNSSYFVVPYPSYANTTPVMLLKGLSNWYGANPSGGHLMLQYQDNYWWRDSVARAPPSGGGLYNLSLQSFNNLTQPTYIYQDAVLQPNVEHTLSFYYASRSAPYGVANIMVHVDSDLIWSTTTTSGMLWTLASVTFIPKKSVCRIKFSVLSSSDGSIMLCKIRTDGPPVENADSIIFYANASNTLSYSGGSTFKDLSKNAHVMTLNNTSSGEHGTISFPGAGTSSYGIITTGLNGFNSAYFTFIFYMFFDGTSARFMSLGRNASTYFINGVSGSLGWQTDMFFDNTSSGGVNGFQTVQTKALTTFVPGWYQYVFVKSGNSGTYYINGEAKGSNNSAITSAYTNTDFVIGTDFAAASSLSLKTKIAAVYAFNTALTSSNVVQNMKKHSKQIPFAYPPVVLTSASETASGQTVSNAIYGNGVYKCKASSYHSAESMLQAFSQTSADAWTIDLNTYTGAGFTYAGSRSMSILGVGTVNGEWLQLTLPYQVYLYSYYVHTWNSEIARFPTAFYILGSNDESTWTVVDTRSNFSIATVENKIAGGITFTLSTPSPVAYQHFRLLATKTSGSTWFSIGIWQLNAVQAA